MPDLLIGWVTFKEGTLWKMYAKANPKESARLDSWVGTVIANNAKTTPQVATLTAKGLVDIVSGWITNTPTPTPTPTPTGKTFESMTAYAQELPNLTAKRQVKVTSGDDLYNALSNLQPGDYVSASAPFTVSGQFNIEGVNLPSPAIVDLTNITFVGGSSTNIYCAVYLDGVTKVWFKNGDLSNAGGKGLLIHAANDIIWYGFKIHDTGDSGLGMLTVGDIIECGLFGEIWNWGGNPALDGHAEKGTGQHGAILADVAGNHVFNNNWLALDVHDGPAGAGVEIGDDDGSPIIGNKLILRAQRLTKVAVNQVGGNAFQSWGQSAVGMDILYLEASNLTGRAVDGEGIYSGVDMSGIIVEYGRASNCCQNKNMNEPIPNSVIWDTRGGVVLKDVQPLP